MPYGSREIRKPVPRGRGNLIAAADGGAVGLEVTGVGRVSPLQRCLRSALSLLTGFFFRAVRFLARLLRGAPPAAQAGVRGAGCG